MWEGRRREYTSFHFVSFEMDTRRAALHSQSLSIKFPGCVLLVFMLMCILLILFILDVVSDMKNERHFGSKCPFYVENGPFWLKYPTEFLSDISGFLGVRHEKSETLWVKMAILRWKWPFLGQISDRIFVGLFWLFRCAAWKMRDILG